MWLKISMGTSEKFVSLPGQPHDAFPLPRPMSPSASVFMAMRQDRKSGRFKFFTSFKGQDHSVSIQGYRGFRVMSMIQGGYISTYHDLFLVPKTGHMN